MPSSQSPLISRPIHPAPEILHRRRNPRHPRSFPRTLLRSISAALRALCVENHPLQKHPGAKHHESAARRPRARAARCLPMDQRHFSPCIFPPAAHPAHPADLPGNLSTPNGHDHRPSSEARTFTVENSPIFLPVAHSERPRFPANRKTYQASYAVIPFGETALPLRIIPPASLLAHRGNPGSLGSVRQESGSNTPGVALRNGIRFVENTERVHLPRMRDALLAAHSEDGPPPRRQIHPRTPPGSRRSSLP